jgi:hypothetical protein
LVALNRGRSTYDSCIDRTSSISSSSAIAKLVKQLLPKPLHALLPD